MNGSSENERNNFESMSSTSLQSKERNVELRNDKLKNVNKSSIYSE
jgi:hypothetical protein